VLPAEHVDKWIFDTGMSRPLPRLDFGMSRPGLPRLDPFEARFFILVLRQAATAGNRICIGFYLYRVLKKVWHSLNEMPILLFKV
jgi:hypothetical protein